MSNLKTGYTLAITIRASASQIWPWLVQVGQGRAGFYTYEWVENLLGANIHSADCILPALQNLQVGDTIRLTPDPYIGQPGQFMTVAVIHPERALVFKQTLPNGERQAGTCPPRAERSCDAGVVAAKRWEADDFRPHHATRLRLYGQREAARPAEARRSCEGHHVLRNRCGKS